MNENKLKPFDLEKAKAGAKVVTRDGRPARIICWDAVNEKYPIIALVEYDDDGKIGEELVTYTQRGTYSITEEYDLDLFMAPTTVERWVNVYKCGCGYCFSNYRSEQEAL